jgi:phosphoenolpyruvate phosphomutase
MVRAGATALCIEDNPTSKRCSLYPGARPALATVKDHVARLRAALEAVKATGSTCRIIARTEALVAQMGVAEAHARATAYANAGADAVFVQSLDASGEDVLAFARGWQRRTPIFIAPTRFPHVTKAEFISAGISHQIFANQGMRAAHAALERTFCALSGAASSLVVEAEISPVAAVAASVGAGKISELEARIESYEATVSPQESAAPAVGAGRKAGKRAKALA